MLYMLLIIHAVLQNNFWKRFINIIQSLIINVLSAFSNTQKFDYLIIIYSRSARFIVSQMEVTCLTMIIITVFCMSCNLFRVSMFIFE